MMYHDQPNDKPARPQAEPEIIPPGAPLPRDRRGWVSPGGDGAARVYVARLGPVAATLVLFGIGVLAAILLLVLIGVALVWAAALGLVIAGAIITARLRQRFRGWR